MTTEQKRVEAMREVVRSAQLPAGYWSVGELADSCYCLLLDGQQWEAGFFERGRFDRYFATDDAEAAGSKFIAWVRDDMAVSEANAAATAEWLKRTGRSRP